MTFLVSGMANLIQHFIDGQIIKMHVFGSEENFKLFIALVLKLLMKNIGNLFFSVCYYALNIPLFFPQISFIFGAGAARFLRLRLRLRANRFGGSGSGSGSDQNVSAPAAPAPAPAPAPHPCL